MSAEESVSVVARKMEERYRQHTPKTAEIMERAKKVFPGGDYRSATWFNPYPIYMERGQGGYTWDLDGNRYIDFGNSNMASVLGHANPKIVEAVEKIISNGTHFGSPTAHVVEHAEAMQKRYPSFESLRYNVTGTEAVMHCIRAARVFTGRPKVMKMAGAYHGMSDVIENNTVGVSEAAYSDLIQGKYNDTELTKGLIEQHKNELCCVIIAINPGDPPKEEFLRMIRETTQQYGIVFVLDEVVSLRLSYGGGQQMFNIRPDLTATGKIIGGGYAMAVFGGRPEIMKAFSPEEPNVAHQSGTFAATPIAMAAGLAAMKVYDHAAVAQINGLGDLMTNRLQATLDELEVGGNVSNLGSLVRMSLAPPGTPSEKAPLYSRLMGALGHSLLSKGVFSPRGGSFAISTPMTEQDIEEGVKAVQESLVELKPTISEVAQS